MNAEISVACTLCRRCQCSNRFPCDALQRDHGSLIFSNCLSLCGDTNQTFSVFVERNDGGRCSCTSICNDNGFDRLLNGATQLFVVPKSIPITLLILFSSPFIELVFLRHRRRRHHHPIGRWLCHRSECYRHHHPMVVKRQRHLRGSTAR